jgi:hypothetical protein
MPAQGLTQIDPLLVPFLEASDEAECDRLLHRLTSETAGPVIKRVIGNKLSSINSSGTEGAGQSDAEDVYSTVILSLIGRLREIKDSSSDLAPIADFASYAAVVTFNAWNAHLRRKYPLRNQLKNKLRYMLTHSRELALWDVQEQEQVCGYRHWQTKQKPTVTTGEVRSLRDDVWALERAGCLAASERTDIQKTALAVLNLFGRPVELDDLVGIVAEVAGVKDLPSAPIMNVRGQRADVASEARGGFDNAVECRLYLEKLWQEIAGLPPRQRVALLLNLKDPEGENGLELFSLTGVANLAKIAQAVEMGAAELAGVWNELPFEDSIIASRLQLTRQQVINLRKCARQRLARRMKQN